MLTINGVALDNPTLGWSMLAPSVPLSALTMELTRSKSAGRDGVIVAPPTRGPVTLKITMRTPKVHLSTLLALFTSHQIEVREVDDSSKTAFGLLVSSTPEQHFPRADFYTHSFLVEIPDGAWRGTESTSMLVPAAVGGASVTLFSGLSAPVQDAIVRLKGPITNPEVTDTSGAFFALDGSLTASQYLRFDSATGRAWLTASDTWSGGDEVSGLVDYGGPRGVFEITPRFPAPSDPTVRNGQLVLRQTSFTTGAGFQVRGRSAHLL